MRHYFKFLINDRIFRNPRLWSNIVLAKLVRQLDAESVLNVSGADDSDKDGKKYRDYFANPSTYHISYYGGYRGESGDFYLDLSEDVSPDIPVYDFVICHTVLEHVYDIFRAAKNLRILTGKYLVVVVPEVQETHGVDDFDDYWRFTKSGLAQLLYRAGFKHVIVEGSPPWIGSRYLFAFASTEVTNQSTILGRCVKAVYVRNNLFLELLRHLYFFRKTS